VPHSHRQLSLVASFACLLVLTACSDVHRVQVSPRVQEVELRKPFSVVAGLGPALAQRDAQRRLYEAAYVIAVAKGEETAKHQDKNGRGAHPTPTVAVSASLDDIMACIKNHESGNYAESSHTSDGSGAFQVIPGTWRAWSERAGYPGYRYAYQAPPSVQDAVVRYMLTNGGAGNWSPKYGPDPCTVGIGG